MEKMKNEEWDWKPSGAWLAYAIKTDRREGVRPWETNDRNPAKKSEAAKTALIPSAKMRIIETL